MLFVSSSVFCVQRGEFRVTCHSSERGRLSMEVCAGNFAELDPRVRGSMRRSCRLSELRNSLSPPFVLVPVFFV